MSSLVRTLRVGPGARARDVRLALSMFGVRGWTFAVAGAIVTLLVVGVPTALIDNPVFGRQLAARPQDYVFWIITAVIGGLIIATFAVNASTTSQGKAASGGLLSTLAVGCPICNKLAVGLLGTSGALNIFGPTQLFIGIASVLLLSWTLLLRAQAVAGSCPTDGATTDALSGRTSSA